MEHELWVKWHILPLFGEGKDLEVRVRAGYFDAVSVGDIFTFNDSVRRRVSAIRRYANFVEMLRVERAERIIPGSTALEVLRLLQKLYPAERERRGVRVFELVNEAA